MKFPEQRQELIDTLQVLSARKYQELAWIRGEYPDEVVYDCLDYAIHFLRVRDVIKLIEQDGIIWILNYTIMSFYVMIFLKKI